MLFQIAQTKNDIDSALSLLYESYLLAGLIKPNPIQKHISKYHLLDTTYIFISKAPDVTMTVSLVLDGEYGIPADENYSEIVNQYRSLYKIAEVTSIANNRLSIANFNKHFTGITQLLVEFARSQGVEKLFISTHPRHLKFYEKLIGFSKVGDEKHNLYVDKPVVLSVMDLLEESDHKYKKHYFANKYSKEELTPVIIDVKEYLNYIYNEIK